MDGGDCIMSHTNAAGKITAEIAMVHVSNKVVIDTSDQTPSSPCTTRLDFVPAII